MNTGRAGRALVLQRQSVAQWLSTRLAPQPVKTPAASRCRAIQPVESRFGPICSLTGF